MSPRSILKTSAIAHVHGVFGALSTRRPSGSVPKRESPPALSKNANANTTPRSGDGRGPDAARRADLVEAPCDLGVADHERFDLGNAAIRQTQPRDEHRRHIGFADGAQQH